MDAKVIYLAGVPASGKSTLFKRIRDKYFADAVPFAFGKCKGIKANGGKFVMLGVFDGSMFEGTDKLSMDVINDAIKFCQQQPKSVIFVEGDRLFNYRFMAETCATLYVIDADEKVLSQRHASRGDSQNTKFLKSRRTKVDNFCTKYRVRKFMNNTPEDAERLFATICKTANNYIN